MILQLLFQIILLSWPVIALAQAPPPLTQPCPPKCGNVTIPFPFGVGDGCYIDDWFAIDCKSGKPFIRSMDLEVLEISVADSTMRVNYPVFSSCVDEFESTTPYAKLHAESPFFFSQKSNRFTALGCNNFAYMYSNDFFVGGCFSYCDVKIPIEEKSCYGINCCQTEIPSFLKVFNASVSIINEEKGKKKGCKYAFLVDQHWFETDVKNPQDVKQMTHVPVVLDWRIQINSSYKLLTSANNATSHCKAESIPSTPSNGNSSNATSSSTDKHPLFYCSCKRGFHGNPYLPNGCQDIDECISSNKRCGDNMICENFEGGYNCLSLSKKSKIHTLSLGFGTGFGSFFLLIAGWWLWIIIERRKAIKRKQNFFRRNGGLLLQELTSSDGKVDRSKIFNSKELDKATDHFNVTRILGQGGQGTVYKGMLSDGRIVAVKRSKVVDEGKLHDFINEFVILSQINHRNAVKLFGCCLETEIPLLVYEFIPNGTLFQYIHDQNEEFPLTWDMRLRIATEVAGALSYLHSAAFLPIYHRDIKSTNILLDEKYRAKIADFGTSRSVAIDQTHVTTKVQGTFGYVDPEYFQSSQFTDKSDVYSFGVVLAELLTGQKSVFSTSSREPRGLAPYFILCMKENALDDILDAHVKCHGRKEDIVAVANLTYRCLNLNGTKRPTMKEVAIELERIRGLQTNNLQQNHEENENMRRVSEDLLYTSPASGSSTCDNICYSMVDIQGTY